MIEKYSKKIKLNKSREITLKDILKIYDFQFKT